jgi:hypothetical protein
VDAGWIVVAVFLAVLGLIVFTVARGMWGIVRNKREMEAGGSWGRQLFGRRRPKT